jgi:AcrR family transcriptional regulator
MSGVTAPTLRSRRRAQVVAEIRRTAQALFAERGYDAVTPEEIAEAAGVSRSTYFRHTPSKESLLVDSLLEGIASLVGDVAARPAREPAPDALARAMVDCMSRFGRADVETWRTAIRSAPHLIERVALVTGDDRRRLVELTASRLGVDAARDVRPGLLVCVTLATAEQVFREWVLAPAPSLEGLPAQVERALELVLTASWDR